MNFDEEDRRLYKRQLKKDMSKYEDLSDEEIYNLSLVTTEKIKMLERKLDEEHYKFMVLNNILSIRLYQEGGLLNELETKCHKLENENEELKQKLDFYLLDEFEWKEKYGD